MRGLVVPDANALSVLIWAQAIGLLLLLPLGWRSREEPPASDLKGGLNTNGLNRLFRSTGESKAQESAAGKSSPECASQPWLCLANPTRAITPRALSNRDRCPC